MFKHIDDERIDLLSGEYNDYNINDMYEYFRELDIIEHISYNMGDIDFKLTPLEKRVMLDNLCITNSDLELGYSSEELSLYIDSEIVEAILLDENIIWDKIDILSKEYRILSSNLRLYTFENEFNIYTKVAQCPYCQEARYITLDLRYSSYTCPNCNAEFISELGATGRSKGEELIENLLKENNLKYKKEVVEIERYRFDFVVEYNDTKFYIEIHGLQHYEPVEHFGGEKAYIERVKSDKIKKDYAKENGIYIELDYREHDLNLLKERFDGKFIEKYIR